MRGLITGHALFATGLKSALELIGGPQENLIALNFTEDLDLKQFQQNITNEIDTEAEFVVFTDVLGGTPFNTVMTAKGTRKNIHVFTGTNLPILIEYLSSQYSSSEPQEIFSCLKETAQEGITFDHKPNIKSNVETTDEGI